MLPVVYVSEQEAGVFDLCVCMRVWLLSLMTAAFDSICMTVTQETMSMSKTAAVVWEDMSV